MDTVFGGENTFLEDFTADDDDGVAVKPAAVRDLKNLRGVSSAAVKMILGLLRTTLRPGLSSMRSAMLRRRCLEAMERGLSFGESDGDDGWPYRSSFSRS